MWKTTFKKTNLNSKFKLKPNKKLFKGCLPQYLLGTFLNILSQFGSKATATQPWYFCDISIIQWAHNNIKMSDLCATRCRKVIT